MGIPELNKKRKSVTEVFLQPKKFQGERGLPHWPCSGCGFDNFATRFQCKCKELFKRGSGDGTNGNGSDWECSACGFKTFASKFFCVQCKQLFNRDGGAGVPTTGVQQNDLGKGKPGRWICSSCSTPNFNRRSTCKQCDADKTEDAEDTSNSPVAAVVNPSVHKQNGTTNPSIQKQDSTTNQTVEDDQPASVQTPKKFKWNKMIKAALNNADDETLSYKKLVKVLFPLYTMQTGEEVSKEEFKGKLEEILKQSARFKYENGTVSM